jgi:predicted PurR-regulated permease PerM
MISAQTPPERTDTTGDRDLSVRVAKATAAALSRLWLVAVHDFQSYVVNPQIGRTVGLSPLVTLLSVAVVGVLFGGLAVILAVPFTSAVATLIDVLVLDREPPTEQPRRSLRLGRAG